MTSDTPTLHESLHHAGLRVTAPRLAVLAALQGVGQHRDAEAIAEAARERLGSLSTQAVYDNLHILEKAGLVRRIQPSGHPARYEARVGDNHHHIVCRRCGVIADVDCAVGEVPCLEPSADHGFIVEEAEVIFWGLCALCRPADSTATAACNIENAETAQREAFIGDAAAEATGAPGFMKERERRKRYE